MNRAAFVLSMLLLTPLTALHAAEPLPTPAALWKEYDPNRGDFNEEIVKQETRDGFFNRRASSRGCMPLSATQYYDLLDWTGRQFRADKCGIIPAELAPIMERLSVNANSWLRLVRSIRNLFRQAAGRPASLAKEATHRGQHRLQGTRTSHSLFNSSVTS